MSELQGMTMEEAKEHGIHGPFCQVCNRLTQYGPCQNGCNTLDSQLANAIRIGNEYRAWWKEQEARAERAEAKLAEVTKERDKARADAAELAHEWMALRAQLRVSKQEELDEICARAKAGDSKAFSTLCTRVLEIVERKTAPPAPEKVSEVVLRVEDAYATDYGSQVVRITPELARQIVALAGVKRSGVD
jgi:hypothetical protein